MTGPLAGRYFLLARIAVLFLLAGPLLQAAEPQNLSVAALTEKGATPPPPNPGGNVQAIAAKGANPTALAGAHSPIYSSQPGFAHAQCASACQMKNDASQSACTTAANQPASKSTNPLACLLQTRSQYASCVNACPTDDKRVQ